MSNCPDCPEFAPNNTSIKINENMEVGCSIPIGYPYTQCPNTAEWQSDGLTSSGKCYYALGSNTCEACVGYGLSGRRNACKRIAYKANPLECCLTGRLEQGDFTCAPDFRDKRAPGCNDLMKKYCSDPLSKIFFSDTCQAWASNNPEADSTLIAVCSRPENSLVPQCGCIVSAIDLVKAGVSTKIPPQCADSRCADPRALKTTSQLKQTCGNNIVCTQNDIKFIQGHQGNSSVNIRNECGNYNPSFNLPVWLEIVIVSLLGLVTISIIIFTLRKNLHK